MRSHVLPPLALSLGLFSVVFLVAHRSSQDTSGQISLAQQTHTHHSHAIETNGTAKNWNRTTCFPEKVTDDMQYFTCPPGNYLQRDAAEQAKANQRLQLLYQKLRTAGYRENDRENISGVSYLDRGYASYESMVWPKPGYCQDMANDSFVRSAWSAYWNETRRQFHNYTGEYYKEDNGPDSISKIVSDDYKFEFHYIWKVASTSFPSYLWCEFWPLKVKSKYSAVKEGYKVAAAVRHPLSRFVSAVSEILQRSVNYYCPAGYCTYHHDGFEGNVTLEEYKELTSWYRYVEHGVNMTLLPTIIEAFVHDTECNYEFYAAEHLTSQSAFISQGGGCAADVDVVIRLEELDDGLDEMVDELKVAQGGAWKNCSMGDSNSASDKPGGIPSEGEMLSILEDQPELMRRLCLIYAQDFICFGYDVPDACSDLF